MKKQFLKFLPIAAALLLATSCSKDDDTNTVIDNEPSNDSEPAPVEVVAQPEYVKIPFSVKVDNGTKLSKISYSEGEGEKVTRSFTDDDVDEGNPLKMTITGEYIESGSTLTLKTDGDNFFFEGEISVVSGKEDVFNTTGIDLTGTFGTALTAAATSTTSLLDLMQTCDHQYKAEFKSSTTEPITIYDQNAYFHFTLAPTQTKMKISIGEYSDFMTNSDGTKEIWIAVAGGTVVSGNLVSTKGLTTAASKIYNADRTDVVDLGPKFSVLWKTANEKGGEGAKQYSQDDAATSVYKDEEYYTWENACKFGRMDGDTYTEGTADPYRLPTKAEFEALLPGTWKTQNSVKGREFSTDYGSVFFPAAGYNGGSRAGSYGNYWSGEPDGDGRAWALSFSSGVADVISGRVDYEFSVRLVRGL